MKKLSPALILLVTLAAITCSRQPTSPSPAAGTGTSLEATGNGGSSSSRGNTPLSATVQFGGPGKGSPFPPGHDQSAHADSLVPGTVVIRAGGSVTFKVSPDVHQIAIYAPGTDPEDIDTSKLTTLAAYAGCAGGPFVFAPLVIDDATNRIADYPIPCFAPAERTHPFPSAGKHLVICSFLPHFGGRMWGWVDVKD